tara:strand:+ start:496 stop:717 length:222 start_codon:yes stop_codon:yes gene_type:complete
METNSNGFCLVCGTRLKSNKSFTNYHIKCWKNMINDIKHFEQVCYTKYDYEKKICGLSENEIKAGKKIVLNFD